MKTFILCVLVFIAVCIGNEADAKKTAVDVAVDDEIDADKEEELEDFPTVTQTITCPNTFVGKTFSCWTACNKYFGIPACCTPQGDTLTCQCLRRLNFKGLFNCATQEVQKVKKLWSKDEPEYTLHGGEMEEEEVE